VGTAAALARESSGHHAALLVATGGIEALQAALDCLPRGEWGAFDLLVGTHAASAIGLVAQHLRHDSHDSHDSQPLWRDPEAQLQVGSPFHRTTCQPQPALTLILTIRLILTRRTTCLH